MSARPDYLTTYAVAAPPVGLARLVVHLATVVPATGRRGKTAEERGRAGVALLGLWRSRVWRLDELEWPLTRDHRSTRTATGTAKRARWRMLDCRPAAFFADVAWQMCSHSEICSHCWGREVRAPGAG